jgi:peptide-methionine (S)-S-oxide reductase
MNDTHETAIFGAGCFWGVEQAFRQVDGVVETAVGYAGGRTDNPSYRDVCSGGTGHAEVVEVTFDPSRVSYDQLLELFWGIHDPTQVNRQGPDVGSQYRSLILTTSLTQETAARAAKAALDARGTFPRPIATEVAPAGPFWRAEDYHQRYLEKRGMAACHTR